MAVIVGDELLFSKSGCPTRSGEIVDTVRDLENITTPRVGMRVWVKSESKEYIITRLKSKVINGVEVPNVAVDKYELSPNVKDFESWKDECSSAIEGEVNRATAAEDALSGRISDSVGRIADIENVMQASTEMLDTLENVAAWIQDDATDSADVIEDVQKNKESVTELKLQTHGLEVTTTGNRFTIIPEIKAGDKVNITLTDATNKDVPLHILVMYGPEGAVTNLGTVTVGDVVKVDATVDFDRIQLWASGMSDEFICHLLFTTDDMTLRKVIENTEQQLTASMEAQRKELIKRIQGTSDNSSASKDSFKVLGSYTEATLGELISAMDAMHAANANSGYEGVWRAYIGNDYITIRNIPVSYTADKWIQIVTGRFNPNTSLVTLHYDEYIRSYNFKNEDTSYFNGWDSWHSLYGKIEDLTPQKITWSNSATLAQWTFRFAGIYDIKGERTNQNDGFPIDNAASGHTINARLVVLDSSLPQASDTPQEDDACITQILMLSNRMGGDGNIYIRSARGHIDRSTWPVGGSNFTPWAKLQTNMEVGLVGYGQAKTLNDFIDNGIYSGVNVISASATETFVMIVINDYAVAGSNRAISQFKYALVAGANAVTYQTRVRQAGSETWTAWKNLNDVDTALSSTSTNAVQNKVVKTALDSQRTELATAMEAQRKELIKRIQGTSDNSSAAKDSFKVLGSYTETTLGELISAMDAMHAANANSGYEGVWRAYIGNDYITIRNIPVGYTADKWMQIVSGRFTPDHNGNPIMVTQYREWVRTHNYNYDDFADIEGWSAWQKTTKQFDTDIANLHSEIKTIDNAISVVPKQLGTFSVISELLAVLDGMCPQGGENSYEKYIAYVGKEQVTVENNRRVDGATTVWHQTLRCHRRLSSVRNSKNIVYGDGGAGILIDYAQSFDFPSYSPTTSPYHDNTVYGEYCRKKIYYSTPDIKESGVWNRWEDMNNPYRSMQSYAKRIAIFGGSFVQYMGGVWESVGTSKYAFMHAGRRYFLVDYLAERLNAKYFDDYAVGGNGNSITTDSAGTPVFAYNTYFQVERSFNTDRTTPANLLDDNSNVYDIYIIMLGINDYAKNIEVGKATDDKNLSGTSATFCSSLKKSIDYIRANAPNAKILMITPFKAYKYSGNTVDFGWNPDTYTKNDKGYKFLDYVRAFKEVAYVTSCPCYDLLSMQNFSAANVDMYYTDGTHPNGLGYYKVADMLAEFIATGVGHGLNFNKTDDALSLTSTNAVQNKVIAQAIEAAVERGRLLALRSLYIEAGAEYNDTGEVIKKTAFWGDEVDHLPGHYYLNGLGDITEEQMAYIYRMKDSMITFLASNDTARGRFWQDMGDPRLRTLFGTDNYGRWITDKVIGGSNPFASMKIEVLKWTNTSGLAPNNGDAMAMKTSTDMFFNNTALKVIDRFMPNKECSFGQAINLVELRLWATNFNIDLSKNYKISKASIIYTIENVLKTTSKTLLITLHSDVYNKCIEGGEWYEEVNAALNETNDTITGTGSIGIGLA